MPATSAAMDLSSSTAMPAVEAPPPSGKRSRRKAKRAPSEPTNAGWATTYYSTTLPSRRWIYQPCRLPFNQTCIQFVPTTFGETPERAVAQLTKLVRTCVTTLHVTLTSASDILFVADLDDEKQNHLEKILAANKITITGTSFSYSAEQRKLRAVVRDNLAAAMLVTDGLTTTDESDSDDEAPAPAKKVTAATPKTHAADTEPARPAEPAPAPEQPAPMETGSSPTSELPADQPAVRPRVQGKRRNIFRAVDFTALHVQVPAATPATTVLFRTVNDGDSLHRAHPVKLTRDLSAFGDYTGLRDIRNGGLAVDFPVETPVDPILATTVLAEIPVTAALPASAADSCSAVLSGVHPELTDAEILENIQTSPPAQVTAVKRLARPGQESWSVKLTFQGSVLPERAMLYGRSRKLSSYTDRPLQCHRCGRYGHAERVCRSQRRCFSCSLPHATAECPMSTQPTCGNCRGPHATDSATCAARAFQQKVCQVRAAAKVPYRTAKIAVSKAARSYSAALRGQQDAPKTGQLPDAARPRPALPAAPAADPNVAVLALFKGLLLILAKSVPCGSYAALATEVTTLFQTLAPGVTFTA